APPGWDAAFSGSALRPVDQPPVAPPQPLESPALPCDPGHANPRPPARRRELSTWPTSIIAHDYNFGLPGAMEKLNQWGRYVMELTCHRHDKLCAYSILTAIDFNSSPS